MTGFFCPEILITVRSLEVGGNFTSMLRKVRYTIGPAPISHRLCHIAVPLDHESEDIESALDLAYTFVHSIRGGWIIVKIGRRSRLSVCSQLVLTGEKRAEAA